MGSEFWHSFAVHFPLALLLLGAALWLLSLTRAFAFLRAPSLIMGVLGCGAGYLAYLSGTRALRELDLREVNPHTLHSHQDQAFTALVFFAAGWGLLLLSAWLRQRIARIQHEAWWVRVFAGLALGAGSVYLFLASVKGVQTKENRYWSLHRDQFRAQEKAR